MVFPYRNEKKKVAIKSGKVSCLIAFSVPVMDSELLRPRARVFASGSFTTSKLYLLAYKITSRS